MDFAGPAAALISITLTTSLAAAYVLSPAWEAVMVQFPVPTVSADSVIFEPEVDVPEPEQPPEATIDTASPELAVALTVNVVPTVFAPGSAKVMVCEVSEAAVMVKVLSKVAEL